MGFFTVSAEHPTVRAKVNNKIKERHEARGGAICDHCGKAIKGRSVRARGATHHPKCARAAAASFTTPDSWDKKTTKQNNKIAKAANAARAQSLRERAERLGL